MESAITLKNLEIGYHLKHQLRIVATSVNASLMSGEVTCLIGTNGVGKSTLLRTMAGFQPPLDGEILIRGKKMKAFNAHELAKEISVVLTSKPDSTLLTVEETVGIGRSPYTGFWGTLSSEDKRVVANALEQVGISHLASRYVTELSDGERQKVMIAKALAQQTSIIILDEPTAFLDFPSKVETLQMLHTLAREQHKAILLSTHDLELVLQIADKLWLMDTRLSIGTPRELASNGNLGSFIERPGIRLDRSNLSIHIE